MSGKVFLREATGLVRDISPFGAFVIGVTAFSPTLAAFFLFSSLPASFPHINVILLMAVVAVPVFCWAMVYLLLNMAMPRAGGDYVWMSRLIHPAVGFMTNFYYFFVEATFLGVIASVTMISFVAFLQMAAIAFQSPSLLMLSGAISTPLNIIILGILILVLVSLLVASGTRNVQRVLAVLFIASTIGIVLFVGVLLITPHSVFISNFNSAFGTDEAGVILKTAQANGFSPGWDYSTTFAGGAIGIETVSGFAWAAYSGSEIKNPSKSSWALSVIPAMFSLGLSMLLAAAVYLSFGYDFSSATGYLFNLYPAAVSTSIANAVPVALPWVYIAYAGVSPYVVAFIGLAFVLGIAATIIPIFVVCTRLLFAYSFDRVLPSIFGQVSERFHTPVISTALIMAIGIVLNVIANETGFYATFFTNVTLGYTITVAIVAIAAIRFPYGRTKALFEQAPKLVKTKIAGIPIITISGAITFITFAYVVFTGFFIPAVGGVLTPQSVLVGIAAPFLIGLVIYYGSRAYHSSHGLNIGLAFKEIPPE